MEAATRQPALKVPATDFADVLVHAPARESGTDYIGSRRKPAISPALGKNYLEIEARNHSLGRVGELFVLAFEHHRLRDAGQKRLADRVEHVAATKGDGLGYDVLSFEASGRERLIEVKTTPFGAMTPFYVTSNEVNVSEAHAAEYQLYRVFRFDHARLFIVGGSLKREFLLDATQYRARIA